MNKGKTIATVYFYIWFVLNVYVTVDDLNNFDLTEFDYFYQIMSVITLIGMYGYVYSTAFWDKHFWRIFLPTCMVVDFYSFGDVYTELALELQGGLLYMVIIVCALLVAPQYIYLYRFSRNESIWIEDH
jgi:hypothetical protein